MEKVIFCVQNAAGIEICPPLANRVLAAHLQSVMPQGSVEASVMDFDGRASVEDMLGALEKEKPDVVCITCYVWNCQKAFALADAIKRERPGVATVLGGIQLNYDARDMAAVLAAHKGIDVIVKRDGELFLSEYFSLNKANRPSGGAVVEGKAATRRTEYEKSVYELYPPHNELYDFLLLNVDGPGTCYFNKCGFCLAPYYNSSFAPTTRAQFIKDVEWARDKYGKLYYNEPYININRKTLFDRARFLEEMGIAKSKRHEVYIRYDIFGEEDAERLAALDAGVGIGLQTIGDEAIRLSNRIFKKDRFEKAVEFLKRRNIDVTVDLLLGLPGETYDGFMAGYEYARSLGVKLNVNRLLVLPGSDFYFRREALGIAYDPYSFNVISVPSMTEGELRKIIEITGAVTVGEERGIQPSSARETSGAPEKTSTGATVKTFDKAAAREALIRARRLLKRLPDAVAQSYKIEKWGDEEALIVSFAYPGADGMICRLAFLSPNSACEFAINAPNFKLVMLDKSPPKKLADEINKAVKASSRDD